MGSDKVKPGKQRRARLAGVAFGDPLAPGVGQTVVAPSVAEGQPALRLVSPRGDGFDLVVEAAGSAETSEAALELAGKGGRVLLFGGCASDVRVPVSPARLHYDEIALLSSFHHTPRHVAAALRALADGVVSVDPLLEDPVGLDGVGAALEAMCERRIRGKVPVLPNGAE